MLKSQDIVVALGVVIATVVILFGTSEFPRDGARAPQADSTSIRPVSPLPEPEGESGDPQAAPAEPRADSLPIVRVALPVLSPR